MKKLDTIVTDELKFIDRVDEITSKTNYDYVRNVVSRLKKMLYEHSDVVALCAPQIGENLRLFVVKTAEKGTKKFKVILNPILVKAEGLHLSRETNASFPNKEFIIPRRTKIHLAFQTEDGHVSSESYLGAYSEVIQQMTEMLDGITIADYGLDLDDVGGPKAYDMAKKSDKLQLMNMYLNSLKEESSELRTEIDNNPELANLDKTIDFMKGMLVGDITPITDSDKDKLAKSN